MGVSHSLVALDPERLELAITEVSERKLATTDDVVSLFQEFDRTPVEDVIEYWDSNSEEENALHRYNFATELACVRRWELGKSLRLELLGLPLAIVPELKTIPLGQFEGFDVQLPESPENFENGLYGAWSAQVIDRWKPVTEFFCAQSRVENYQMPRMSVFDRATGRSAKIKKALATWQEEFNWSCWCDVVSAVRHTCEHRSHLGFEQFL